MASTTPPSRSQPRAEARPLPGSWEGVLQQAREHAANGNAQAIPNFEKVIGGLARLPESRRRAAGGKLQDLYMQAVVGVQSFYATRDRFDEAIAVVQAALPQAANDELNYLEEHLIGLQFIAGHNDAAIQALRRQAEGPDSEITDWNPVIWGYIRSDRAHEALPLLDELDARYQRSVTGEAGETGSVGSADAPDPEDDPVYIAACINGLRSVALLESGNLDGGIQAFERALSHPQSPYRHSLHLLYSRLSNAGRYEDALRFIQRDAGFPARAGFWRGLTYRRMGRNEDARTAWRGLAELEPSELQRAPVEFTLARYYLGDPEGQTLSGVLGALRQNEHPNWTLLMLAGVGFALRGDRDTARNDFRLAVSLVKSLGEGRKLPVGVWHIVKDLFSPEDTELFAQYFEMPLPNTIGGQTNA